MSGEADVRIEGEAWQQLKQSCRRSGETPQELVDRSIRLYSRCLDEAREGARIIVQPHPKPWWSERAEILLELIL